MLDMSTGNITLDQLSPEARQALMLELKEAENKKAKETAEQRKNYKKLVDESVRELFPKLQDASAVISNVKKLCYDTLSTLVKMKSELYESKEDLYSHSFSTEDANITIIIGHNMLDGWDDTANTGIAKVNEFISGLGKDKKSRDMADALLKLLSKDSKGNLKASRVLQLKQWAEQTGDAGFIDAVQIIQDAYRPVRSKEFVRCVYKGNDGSKLILPLSITDAPINEAENAEIATQ